MSIFGRPAYLSTPKSPNDQRMIQNYEWVKDPFKIQDRTMGFDLIKYKSSLI